MPVFDRVVVGATDSEGAERAFRRALALTQATGGTLHIVAAIDTKTDGKAVPWLPEEFRYTGFGAGAADWLLMRLQKEAAAADVAVTTHPVLDDPAGAIARVAADEGADLVVVGSGSAHGTRRLAHVPKAVMDHVGCAVLVV
jgi:nucleotide-binding universal stress UspA family protein